MKLMKKFLIQTYNVGIIRKNIGEILEKGVIKNDILWLKHNYRDRFFADPFLIKVDSNYYYILVEEFIFWEEKGKISLLTVDKNTFALVRKKVLIEEATHLSFPFCELNGNYVIPESTNSGKTKKYTLDTEKMEIVSSEIIVEEGLIDASFFTDRDNKTWVFASKNPDPKADLYLLKKEGNRFVQTNGGKPVYSNILDSRSAGRLFYFKGCLYRPVQDCSLRYGCKTRIIKIDSFGEFNYDFTTSQILSSVDNPPFVETMHTFNVYDDFVIVDGSKDMLRFPTKLFYKIKKKFLKKG